MPAATSARRAAAALRAHALAGGAAIATSVVVWLRSPEILVPAAGHPSTQYGVRPMHLGVAAPLWLVAAWQLAVLRRRAAPGRGLGAAALWAGLAAAGAVAAELLATVTVRLAASDGPDLTAIAALVVVVAATGWTIATCRATARIAARLAANTLNLPTVRARERALHLGTALRALPWSLPLAVLVAIVVGQDAGALAGLALALTGQAALVAAQLALAHLLARSRELAAATVAAARR